jgi:membrane-anchored protein YejM (alkaline phosphatase superfamily)
MSVSEKISYSIVQVTRVAGNFKGSKFEGGKFERLSYHYLSVDHAMEHMVWAQKQFFEQSKEENPHFSLVSIDIGQKTWNETQHRENPTLERFVLHDGNKVPAGGRTFKSI